MHDYIQQITLAKGSGEYCICEQVTLRHVRANELIHCYSAYFGPRCSCSETHRGPHRCAQDPGDIHL
jgi:hypothetical protein